MAYTTPVEVDGSVDMFATSMSAQRNLVKLSNDTLVCVYVNYEWDLGYATSEDDGRTWTIGHIMDLEPYFNFGIASIASDSYDMVWCVYEYYDEGDDKNMILVTAYLEGEWSPPFPVDLPGDDEDQFCPFVAINSTNEIFITWTESNDTDSWIELLNFSVEQFPFDFPEPSIVNITEEPSEEFDPVLAFDGNDTVHITYNYYNDTSNVTIKYVNRTVGSDEFSPVINLSMDPGYDNMYPSICVNDTGIVFIAFTYGNMSDDYKAGLFYGNPPTHNLSISDEVEYVCDIWEVSVGWYGDELHLLHDDYIAMMIDHVHGTPEGGWNLTISISSGTPSHDDSFHMSPSLRWAYYFEPKDTIDYVFYDYNGFLMGGDNEIFWLYYQDITGTDPEVPPTILDQISSLTQTVVSIFSLILVVVILRGLVISMNRSFRGFPN